LNAQGIVSQSKGSFVTTGVLDLVYAYPFLLGVHCADFYRGRVMAIFSSEATFDIVYDGGDENLGVERTCLRPFEPFRVNEIVQVREPDSDDDVWWDGTIIRTSHDADGSPLCDVKFENEMVWTDIESGDIRRVRSFIEGESVSAYYEDRDEWFSGIISNVNSDGSYSIEYEDGDVDYSVPRSRIRRGE